MRNRKPIIWLVCLGVILVCIKRIFTDFDIDCEYAIALSYRMARGDKMIVQMWEPHQTSAFLNAIFIKIYLFLTGTVTGIALYLNIMGTLAKAGVAIVFYRTFRKICDHKILFLMCSFFMTVCAKNSIILEFSNMMIYFSILLFCALYTHLQKLEYQKPETLFLVLASFCLCLQVLSYPSAVILFVLVLLILNRYSLTKGRDMVIFSGSCFAVGSAFCAYLVFRSGWDRFWVCIRNIVTGDSSHTVADLAEKTVLYVQDIRNVFILFAICAFLAVVISVLPFQKRRHARRIGCIKIFFILLFLQNISNAMMDIGNRQWLMKIRLLYLAVYIPFVVLAAILKKYCSRDEKMLFSIGLGISISSCIAVLLLTNLPFLSTLAYLILGIMVSMVPIGAYLRQAVPETSDEKRYVMLFLFVLVVIFRNIYIFRPMNRMQALTVSINNVVRDGPLKGIFSDYMGPHIMNCNMEDWKQYIQKGDRVMIVGFPSVSTIGYLYEDTEICVDSTICTPTYSEKLLQYWEINPWKEPNVVVDCWFGELRIPEDTWIRGWLEENFDSYVDGTYIRIYYRE